MLFNSFVFIFIFLPLMFACFYILRYYQCNLSAKIALIIGSLFFYAYWKVEYIFILLFSILVNYCIANILVRTMTRINHSRPTLDCIDSAYSTSLSQSNNAHINNPMGGGLDKSYCALFSYCTSLLHRCNAFVSSPKYILIIGICFNVALLGYYKYMDFFLENFNLFTQLIHLDYNIPLPHIMLPLALSFVTFQQIAFLCDCYKNIDINDLIESKDISHAINKAESSHSRSSLWHCSKESLQAESTIPNTTESSTNDTSHNRDTIKTRLARFFRIDFLDYCLFISFFPQLIAGPIVHHKEMMPQFKKLFKKDSSLGNHLASFKNFESSQTLSLTSPSRFSKKHQSNTTNPRILDSHTLDSNDISHASNTTESSIANAKPKHSLLDYESIAKGLFIFCIGLFKKTILADSFAKWANAGFGVVESGGYLNIAESWATSLSYTFQLYFDFSGYCDMAIGLGLLFGITLPINFNSPYKALNIADFWRRWHMTLGRFFKDYLYIPLGGNKNAHYKGILSKGVCAKICSLTMLQKILTLRNLFIVAFVSGVWHGAGFGFIIWGVLHGCAMIIHRVYRWILDSKIDSSLGGHSACSESCGSAYAHSLHRMSNTTHSLASHNPQNSSTILECQENSSSLEILDSSHKDIKDISHSSNTTESSHSQSLWHKYKNTQQSLKNCTSKLKKFLDSKLYIILCWFITFNFINITWVFFRAKNIDGALHLLEGMFGIVWVELPQKWYRYGIVLSNMQQTRLIVLFLVCSFVLCLCCKNSIQKLQVFKPKLLYVLFIDFVLFYFVYILISTGNQYTEFIYFNF